MSRRPNQAVRARIVRIARELYHEHGLAAVSMETVAAAAGLKKANLFHYFPTRDALQLEVIEQASQGMRQQMRACFARARHPIRAVARLFDEARAAMRKQGCRGGCRLPSSRARCCSPRRTRAPRPSSAPGGWQSGIWKGSVPDRHGR
jgi:AcrR family transcriptional regulator